MKASELRIGNIVARIDRSKKIHLPVVSHPMQILEIKLFNCQYYHYNENPALVKEWYKSDLNDIAGIPLTEEWLVKFGFERYCGDYVKNGVHIGEHEEWEGETTFKFSIGDIVSFKSINIKYVHQFQNLFYSLVGEELTLK